MHEAAFTNNTQAIRDMLDSGLEIGLNQEDGDGYTPIMIAIWFEKLEALKELLTNRDVNLEVDGQKVEEMAG